MARSHSPPHSPPLSLDKARGMLWAFALGDALGSPCEFNRKAMMEKWAGRFTSDWVVRRRSRFGATTECPLGMTSDDTEMTLALLHTFLPEDVLLDSTLSDSTGTPDSHAPRDPLYPTTISSDAPAYSRPKAIAAYVEWANSGCPFLGRNTRALFHGYKRPLTYASRFEKAFGEDPGKAAKTQPNGCLMRASPLALLPSRAAMHAAVRQDVTLTNPNDVSVEATRLYCDILWDLVRCPTLLKEGQEPWKAHMAAARERWTSMALHDLIVVLDDAEAPTFTRKITAARTCGWICHALACALFHLHHWSTLGQAIQDIIELGGDTDTNAAITAALLGARDGMAVMEANEWVLAQLAVVRACFPSVRRTLADGSETVVSRPSRYCPDSIDTALAALFPPVVPDPPLHAPPSHTPPSQAPPIPPS